MARQAHAAAAELLGDERERRPRGLADPERQVPGLPAHRDDEVPAPGGLRVDHQVVDDLDADGARRLVPEGPHVVRQVEIVVDGLGHVNDPQPAAGGLRQLVGRERGVVAADGEEHADVEPLERRQDVAQVLGPPGRVRARDADAGAAAEVDAARVLDRERGDVRDVARHEPLEALLEPEDFDVGERGADGRRPDDAVDAGRRAAGDDDGELAAG